MQKINVRQLIFKALGPKGDFYKNLNLIWPNWPSAYKIKDYTLFS